MTVEVISAEFRADSPEIRRRTEIVNTIFGWLFCSAKEAMLRNTVFFCRMREMTLLQYVGLYAVRLLAICMVQAALLSVGQAVSGLSPLGTG